MFVLIGRAVWECTVEYVGLGSNKTNWQGRMNGSINQGSSDSVRQVKKKKYSILHLFEPALVLREI